MCHILLPTQISQCDTNASPFQRCQATLHFHTPCCLLPYFRGPRSALTRRLDWKRPDVTVPPLHIVEHSESADSLNRVTRAPFRPFTSQNGGNMLLQKLHMQTATPQAFRIYISDVTIPPSVPSLWSLKIPMKDLRGLARICDAQSNLSYGPQLCFLQTLHPL